MGSYGKPLMAIANAYGLIRIPEWPEARTLGARNRQAVWQTTPEGEALLARHERHTLIPRESDQNPHKYLRAIIRFSFDEGPLEIDGLTRRSSVTSWRTMTARPPRARTSIRHGFRSVPNSTLSPTMTCLGTPTHCRAAKSAPLSARLRGDRGTETITGQDRRTIEGKIRNYALYLNPKNPFSYRKRYGLSNCLVPIVTTKAGRAQTILALIHELAPEQAHKFIVKVLPDFGAMRPCDQCRPSTRSMCETCKGTGKLPVPCPPPTAHMLTEDWMQSGGRTLNL